MKRFWYLGRLRRAVLKAKRSGKPVKVPRSPLFNKGEVYPLYVSVKAVDKNDPEYIRMVEEAGKVFQEAPLPDFLRKRAMEKD
jgi:hypothetical protein